MLPIVKKFKSEFFAAYAQSREHVIFIRALKSLMTSKTYLPYGIKWCETIKEFIHLSHSISIKKLFLRYADLLKIKTIVSSTEENLRSSTSFSSWHYINHLFISYYVATSLRYIGACRTTLRRNCRYTTYRCCVLTLSYWWENGEKCAALWRFAVDGADVLALWYKYG